MSFDTKGYQSQLAELDKQLEKDEAEANVSAPIGKVNQSGVYEIHTTVFLDEKSGKRYPILATHSPYPIVEKILRHNSVAGYTGIINAGQSGTGKTTWTKFLVHALHERMPSVIIDWFDQYDLTKIDDIVEGLQKGVPHIIVFDDASFALDDLPRHEVNKLAQLLTRIRHVVRANVITILNIHYSKAIGKYWRNIPFYFLTSISNEEMASYEDVFGTGSKWKLRDFSWLFHSMMLEGSWSIETDAWTGKKYYYQTNRPFRLGLASELNKLHFFVYTKMSCGICDPEFEARKILDAKDLVTQLLGLYSRDRVRSTLRYYLFTRKGIKSIDRTVVSLWNTLSDLDRKNDIDWNVVGEILDEQLVKKRPRFYSKKKEHADEVREIEKNSFKSNETSKNSFLIDPSILFKI